MSRMLTLRATAGFAGIAVLWALLPAAASAASSSADKQDKSQSSPAQAAKPEQELDEIIVNGHRIKANRDPVQILAWLRRLLGKYRYEGYVELGDGSAKIRQPVTGAGDCVAFGAAPGVHCTIQVSWPEVRGPNGEAVPGGVSTLVPAMVQYGLDPDRLGVRYMQVDNRGMAERGNGYLWGDVLETKSPCVGIAGNCQRITHIEAHPPDGSLIEMQVDIEKDSIRLMRYRFEMHRTAAARAGAESQKPDK